MGDDWGAEAHRDKRGTPCEYCGEPSVMTFIVAPAVGRGKLLDTRIGLCEKHRRQPEPPIPTRGGVDRTAKQTALDVGDA